MQNIDGGTEATEISRAIYGLHEAPRDWEQAVVAATWVAAPIPVLLFLIQLFWWLLETLVHVKQTAEIFGLLYSAASAPGRCCRRCCCRKRNRAQENWERLVGSESFYDAEREYRWASFAIEAWSIWSKIGNAIRASQRPGAVVHFVPYTWQDWNRYSTRIRQHPWNRAKRDLEQRGRRPRGGRGRCQICQSPNHWRDQCPLRAHPHQQ